MLHAHTHRHTPPHHEDEHPAVEKLDCTDFAVMSRELDRAADLKQLRVLPPKEREGKGLRIPWIERRSNESILKEISPRCSLEGLVLTKAETPILWPPDVKN